MGGVGGGMVPPGSGTPGLLHSGQAGGGARNYTDLYRKYTEVVSRRYMYCMYCSIHIYVPDTTHVRKAPRSKKHVWAI